MFKTKDSLFLFLWLGFGVFMTEIWFIKYILHCYLIDNMWWGNSFEWFGDVLGWIL